MSETLVEDDSAYPTDITVPEDGDARNAASVVVGFQGLANRTAHFWSKVLQKIIQGGTITVASALTWALGSEIAWTFTGSDSNIVFGSGTRLVVDRNVRGPLFLAGTDGRANKKILTGTPGSNQSIDPSAYNVFRYTPSTAIEAQIAAGTYVAGDHFRMINASATATRTITVKNEGGSTLFVVPIASGSKVSYVDIVYDGTNWLECGSFDAALT